jgi:hypothetical protein
VKLLHDRRMPRHGTANIDHLAIGAGGITVIDTKNYSGKLRLDRIGGMFTERRTVLMIGGHDRTDLVVGVQRQIASVQSVLAGRILSMSMFAERSASPTSTACRCSAT